MIEAQESAPHGVLRTKTGIDQNNIGQNVQGPGQDREGQNQGLTLGEGPDLALHQDPLAIAVHITGEILGISAGVETDLTPSQVIAMLQKRLKISFKC